MTALQWTFVFLQKYNSKMPKKKKISQLLGFVICSALQIHTRLLQIVFELPESSRAYTSPSLFVEINKYVLCIHCGKPCRSFKIQTFWSPVYPLLNMMIVYFPHKRFILCYIYKCLVSFPTHFSRHYHFYFFLLLSSLFFLNRTKWKEVDSIETKVIGKIHRNCRKMWKQNQRET